MQYFVSAENSPYFHWQLELLIESFKVHNLDSQLVIGLANGTSSTALQNYSKNIINHKHKFCHENFGKFSWYPPLNRIYSIMTAIQNGILSTPFCLIHPDMVLNEPIIVDHQYDIEFSATVEVDYLKSKIETDICEIATKYGLKREQMPEWLPIGDVILFNRVPENFFYLFLEKVKALFKIHKDDIDCYKAALILMMYEMIGPPQLKIKVHDFERTLLDHDISNFIHYKHGMPPVFHKSFYFKNDISIGSNDPFEILQQNNPTPATAVVHKVLDAYSQKK